jgi:hypothetical protein
MGHAVVMSSSKKEAIRLSGRNQASTDRGHVALPLAFTVNDKGLPEKVFQLRKRLYIKATRGPRYPTGLSPFSRALVVQMGMRNCTASEHSHLRPVSLTANSCTATYSKKPN